jgi:hypothetical protein
LSGSFAIPRYPSPERESHRAMVGPPQKREAPDVMLGGGHRGFSEIRLRIDLAQRLGGFCPEVKALQHRFVAVPTHSFVRRGNRSSGFQHRAIASGLIHAPTRLSPLVDQPSSALPDQYEKPPCDTGHLGGFPDPFGAKSSGCNSKAVNRYRIGPIVCGFLPALKPHLSLCRKDSEPGYLAINREPLSGIARTARTVTGVVTGLAVIFRTRRRA